MKIKFLNVEFLRFLFILSILMCHFRNDIIKTFGEQIYLYNQIMQNTGWAWIAIEFFFIISGFFLFLNIDKNMDTVRFCLKKLSRFMPVIVFIILLKVILIPFIPLHCKFLEAVFTLLNIENVGLTFRNGPIPAAWFVSALFWAQLALFYLYKIVDKKWFNFILAIIAFLGYSYFTHTTLKNWQNTAIVLNSGLIRAFAGLSLGYFISMWFKQYGIKIRQNASSIWTKIICTGLEGYLLVFIVEHLCFHKAIYDNRLIMVIAFTGLFMLFLLSKGYISGLLNNRLSKFLGQFTMSIFLSHQLTNNIWSHYVCKLNNAWVMQYPLLNILLLLFVSILFGMAIFYFVEKPIAKILNKKLEEKS